MILLEINFLLNYGKLMPSLVSSSFLSRRILPEKADSFDTFVTVILTSDGTQLVNAVGYAALIEISPVQMKEGSLVLKQFGDHCWSHFSLNKSKSTKNAIQFDKFIKSLGDIEFWPKIYCVIAMTKTLQIGRKSHQLLATLKRNQRMIQRRHYWHNVT